MVDLEELGAPAEVTAMEARIGLCRLCLRHDKTIANIFKEEIEAAAVPVGDSAINSADGEVKKMPLVERLFDLLGVKFEYSASLPSSICQRCFALLEAFGNFRENVQRCETELQRWLDDANKRAEAGESQRPGLNGNPGEFEPEEDCIITEVDPDQEYESSEDDFSMESDTEMEEQSEASPNVTQTTLSLAQTLTEDEKTNIIDNALMTQPPPPIPPATANAELLNNDKIQPTAPQVHDISPTFASQHSMLTNNDTFIAGEILVRNTYLCQICDMAFTVQSECQEHESQHDSVAPYVCTFCSQRTSSRQNLIYHIKELHDPERPYVCAICKKGFVRRSDLKKHTIVHTGVRPFACPVCGKSFSRNTNLTKHIRIHNSIKPHVCTYCPRSFSSAIDLLRHVRTHTSSRPYQCTRCPSTFSRQDKLQLHEEAHYRRDAEMLQAQTGGNGTQPPLSGVVIKNEDGSNAMAGQSENIVVALNPYGDTDATQVPNSLTSPQDQFRAQQNILQTQLQQQQRPVMPKPPPHKPSHPRIFTCTICQKTFTRERDLQRHQALHLDTLFTCKQCGTGFNRREKLARHELEFHAPQHPCEVCRIQFSKRDEYEMHMKMHELQQNAVMATQAAISAAAGMVFGSSVGAAVVDSVFGLAGGVPNTSGPLNLATNSTSIAGAPPPPAVPLPKDMSTTSHRPSAADMSFYSQLVPTMNLGFYNETRPEDRNGI
ncbi:zinc finger protein piragua [Eurosta solidaginis]|uniref:zinc finger protein piragua n=1 Tax=Eurosta solidaginis TaxID=178769 RepID=UPI0035308D05